MNEWDLPKSLVHTAMRTSSSEQGLQETKKRKHTKKKHSMFSLILKSMSLFFMAAFISSKEVVLNFVLFLFVSQGGGCL